MSGRKQFDEEAALDAAMVLFWQRGFEATSLSDLEVAMGLNKSSIYNAFESKEALYARCLERFGAQSSRHLSPLLAHPDLRTALTGFFEALFWRMEAGLVPKGCMITMAAIEVGGGCSRPAELVTENLDSMRDAFEDRLARAKADGQLPPDTDCEAAAAALLAMTRGIAVLNRGYGDTATARVAVKCLLGSLLPAEVPTV